MGEHLLPPAHMTILTFFTLVGVIRRELFLPLLPFMIGGLDGQDIVLFESEPLPLRIGIYPGVIPGSAAVQLFEMAVAGRAKPSLIKNRVKGCSHRGDNHVVIGAKDQDGRGPRGGLSFQNRGHTARFVFVRNHLSYLMAIVTTNPVPFRPGRTKNRLRVLGPWTRNSGGGSVAGDAVAVTSRIIQLVPWTDTLALKGIRPVKHIVQLGVGCRVSHFGLVPEPGQLDMASRTGRR